MRFHPHALNLPLLATVLVLPALQGCRPVGTDYVRPRVALPERFAVPAGEGVAQMQGWTTLGDPILTRFIAQAFAASPDMALAEARLRQARAQQGVQEAQGGPTLTAEGRVSRDRMSRNGESFANVPVAHPRVDFSNFQLGFDASWELDFFGHQRRLSEAARARTEASAERLGDARLILAAEVARSYIELRAVQQRLVLAEANGRLLEDLVKLAQISFQAGESSEQELRPVRLNLANHLATVPGLEVSLRDCLTRLATLTAQPVAEVQAQVGHSEPLMAVPPPPAAGLPSDLLNRRPNLRSAERDLQAANADVGVALAERYPRFSLVGSGGWNSIESGTLLQNASRTWSLGPQFSLPLFNQGRLKAQVRAHQAAYDAALASYHKAVLEALADVDMAFTRLAQDERRRGQLLAAEAHQEKLLELTRKRVEAGDSPRTALIQAHRSLIEAQDQVVNAQCQSLLALVSIYKALGGGWAEGPL